MGVGVEQSASQRARLGVGGEASVGGLWGDDEAVRGHACWLTRKAEEEEAAAARSRGRRVERSLYWASLDGNAPAACWYLRACTVRLPEPCHEPTTAEAPAVVVFRRGRPPRGGHHFLQLRGHSKISIARNFLCLSA